MLFLSIITSLKKLNRKREKMRPLILNLSIQSNSQLKILGSVKVSSLLLTLMWISSLKTTKSIYKIGQTNLQFRAKDTMMKIPKYPVTTEKKVTRATKTVQAHRALQLINQVLRAAIIRALNPRLPILLINMRIGFSLGQMDSKSRRVNWIIKNRLMCLTIVKTKKRMEGKR